MPQSVGLCSWKRESDRAHTVLFTPLVQLERALWLKMRGQLSEMLNSRVHLVLTAILGPS